jgi:hypothetical protein
VGQARRAAKKKPLPETAMVFGTKYNQPGNPSDFRATMDYSVTAGVLTMNRSANRQPDEA